MYLREVFLLLYFYFFQLIKLRFRKSDLFKVTQLSAPACPWRRI